MLGLHPSFTERVSSPIHVLLQLGVRHVAVLESQGGPAAASLLDVAVHQWNGHIELAARRAAGQLEHAPRLQQHQGYNAPDQV